MQGITDQSLNLFNRLEIMRGVKRRVKERLKHYVKDQYACDLIEKLLTQVRGLMLTARSITTSSGQTRCPAL